MWRFEPVARPTMSEIEFSLNYFLDQLDRGIPLNLLTFPPKVLPELLAF